MKKNRVILIVSVLIGLIGAGNLIVGAWSLLTINSLNLPNRISEWNLAIESFNPSKVNTLELQEPLSNLKNSATEGLNFVLDQSQVLNAIPLYFMVYGILFVVIAIVIYFIASKEEKEKER